jgi:predicted aminopeptidase
VLYASDLPDDEKRVRKAEIFADMRTEYERIKAGWDGAPVFDRWFASGANNAGIVAAGLYADHVQQFAALLAAESGDLPRFYERVRELAVLPKAERERALEAVAGRPPATATAPRP